MELEYRDLILIIYNYKGQREENYLFSVRDLQKACPELAKRATRKNWQTFAFSNSIHFTIHSCEGVYDFNRFADGFYNGMENWRNRFYTNDDGGLNCYDLFNNRENTYFLR